MQELISPAQSEKLVLCGALLLALWGAVAGYRALGAKGLLAALPGLLVLPLWQLHKYLTRFDPQTGYFGLDKVKVLLGEVVLFVALGAALGWTWKKISFTAETQRRGETPEQ
jgi:F0F1-type ATP synthase assembly protein I